MMGLSSYGEPKYKDIILNNFFVNKNYKKLNLNLFNHHKKREFIYNFSESQSKTYYLMIIFINYYPSIKIIFQRKKLKI